MANSNGTRFIANWLLPLLSSLLLLAVTGLGWYARDTRETMHKNTERLVAAETEVVNTKCSMARIEGAVGDLDSKFDRKFDELMRELRDARSSTGHTGSP